MSNSNGIYIPPFPPFITPLWSLFSTQLLVNPTPRQGILAAVGVPSLLESPSGHSWAPSVPQAQAGQRPLRRLQVEEARAAELGRRRAELEAHLEVQAFPYTLAPTPDFGIGHWAMEDWNVGLGHVDHGG